MAHACLITFFVVDWKSVKNETTRKFFETCELVSLNGDLSKWLQVEICGGIWLMHPSLSKFSAVDWKLVENETTTKIFETCELMFLTNFQSTAKKVTKHGWAVDHIPP